MASTFTPNLGLELPQHGDYASTGWDNPMDNSLNQLDTAYGGVLNLTVSGGTLVLTKAQAANPVIVVSGTLSADQYVVFPFLGGRRLFVPNLNMNGHTLYVWGSAQTTTSGVYFWNGWGVPFGICLWGSTLTWDYGSVISGTMADLPVSNLQNGWLPCDGRWVRMDLHQYLYDVLGGTYGVSGSFPSGSFALPDLRGCVTAMADQVGTIPASGPYAYNAGNRGILNNWGINTLGGEANHTLSWNEMPVHSHPDNGHFHGVNDNQHQHQINNVGLGSGVNIQPGAGFNLVNSSNTQPSTANISIQEGYAQIGNSGAAWSHNNIQPTRTTVKMIKW